MTTQNIQGSEVARLRQAIIDEHLAGQRALHEFAAGTMRHDFIAAKQQRIGQHFLDLAAIVGGEQEAIAIVADTLASVEVGGNHASH